MFLQSKGLRSLLHGLGHTYVLTTIFSRSTKEQQATAAANGDPNSPFVPSAYPKQEQLLYTKIESLMKEQFKCHRCALDFDRHWVNSMLRTAKVKDD
jgi:hypothetical protein